MDVRDVEELEAWLDGELPAARLPDVERRVAGDPVLARRWAEGRALGRLLALYPEHEAAPDLPARILGRVRAAGGWRRRAAAVAAALLVAGALAWALRPGEEGGATPPGPGIEDYAVLIGTPAAPAGGAPADDLAVLEATLEESLWIEAAFLPPS